MEDLAPTDLTFSICNDQENQDSRIKNVECSSPVELTQPVSCEPENEDYKISCLNSQSLHDICKIVNDTISTFASSSAITNSELFTNRFSEVFKSVLQENIIIDGMPWLSNKKTVDTEEKKENKLLLDEALITELKNKIIAVSSKRKHFPKQCCRILKHKLRNERLQLQNVKTKGTNTLPHSKLIKDEDWTSLENKVQELSKDYKNVQQTLQFQIDKINSLRKDSEFASAIITQQNLLLKNAEPEKPIEHSHM